jgi:tetratricopeptide (TPR) repeat protein
VAKRALDSKVDFKPIREWVAAARQHQPGQVDAPLTTIARWPLDRTALTVTDVAELAQAFAFLHANHGVCSQAFVGGTCVASIEYRGRQIIVHIDNPALKAPHDEAHDETLDQVLDLTPDEVRTGQANRLLEQGAMLHSDIATLGVPGRTAALQDPGRPGSIKAADGQVQGVENASDHWGFARHLLGSVDAQPARFALLDWKDFSPDPTAVPFVRDWYLATSAYLASRQRWSDAAPNLFVAERLFPNDAWLLYYSGTMHEVFAGPAAQEAAQNAVRAGFEVGVLNARSELLAAEALLRRAVAADPKLAEARMKLGHVVGLLGRHDEAARELTTAAAGLRSPHMQYYAALFLGQELAATGASAEARACFEHAAALFPAAQSPLVALGALALRDGDLSGSRGPLDRLRALPPADARGEDPWWIYDLAHVLNADAMLAALRQEAPAGAAR